MVGILDPCPDPRRPADMRTQACGWGAEGSKDGKKGGRGMERQKQTELAGGKRGRPLGQLHLGKPSLGHTQPHSLSTFFLAANGLPLWAWSQRMDNDWTPGLGPEKASPHPG